VELHPFAFLDSAPAAIPVESNLKGALPDFPLRDFLIDAFAAAAVLALLVAAPLAGLWGLRGADSRRRRRAAFMLALGICAGGQALLLNDTSGPNLLYTLMYGLVPMIALSTAGLVSISDRYAPAVRKRLGAFIAVAAVAAAALAAIAWAPGALDLFDVTAPQGTSHQILFRYGGLLAVLAAAYLAARRSAGAAVAAALVTALVISGGAFAGPFDYFRSTPLTPHDAAVVGKGIDGDQYRALAWIRDNTDPDDVIAVNNYAVDPGGLLNFFTAYSAYSERRTFIEGWRYSERSVLGVGHPPPGADPYGDRTALNAAAYAGDPAAIDELRDRWGVRYMVMDKAGASVPVSPCVYGFGTLVVATASMDVLKLSPSGTEPRTLPSQRCKAAQP
jgi:MFS family permease